MRFTQTKGYVMDNTKIIAETFFTNLPKNAIALESDFVRLDRSIIWKFNELFWRNYSLWEKTYSEHFESSLPSGISESHRPEFIESSAKKFLQLVEKLEVKNKLPNKIYVYEQGPGAGLFAKGFLDNIKTLRSDIYENVIYLASDSSCEILKACFRLLHQHEAHIKLYMQDAFEDAQDNFKNKILYARHSNVWGQLPCRLISIRKSGLAEVYVRAIVGKKYEDLIHEIKERGLEYVLIKHVDIWKEFFRCIKLQARSISFSEIDLENSYLRSLKETSNETAGNETLLSELIVNNLSFLNGLIDWERNGYIEVVDLIAPSASKRMRPLKFDGAISYKVDSGIIKSWGAKENKSVDFHKIRKLNTLITIKDKSNIRNARFLEFVRTASWEIFPTESLLQNSFLLPKDTYLAITCTSQKGLDYTIDTAISLKKLGLIAYPHIAARYVLDEKNIKHINNILRKNNVYEIFVAAGDTATISGKYASSIELLNAFGKVGLEYKKIGVAGYPEGHPSISNEHLIEALKQKQDFATKMNIDMNIISQLCFDADVIIKWAISIKEMGITLPIIIGIPGPCNGLKLLHFAIKCGVGQSIKFLGTKGELGKKITKNLAFTYSPDALISQIIDHPQFEESNIGGIHFYTFNNINGLLSWQEKFLNA